MEILLLLGVLAFAIGSQVFLGCWLAEYVDRLIKGEWDGD